MINPIVIAREVVARYHSGQMYGDIPYLYHLEEVERIVAYEGESARVLALLHDVLEDTKCTKETLKYIGFTAYLVECVSLLTDEDAPSRKERKRLTNEKLSKVSTVHELVLIVKAADRLANVRHSSRESNKYLTMYKKEYPAFKVAAYREGLCDKIWEELDDLLL